MTNPSFFNEFFIWPILNVLIAIYQVLFSLGIPYSLGFSIIVLTAVIRLVLYPLISSQLRASKKMQDLNPHIADLKERHKGDAKRLQTETMNLYKQHGVNPAAGCLPVLIQLPVLWGIYSVLQQVVSINSQQAMSQINQIVYHPSLKLTTPWQTDFFGIPLGQNPSQLLTTLGVVVFLIPVVTGLLQFIQSKMMFPSVAGKKKSDDFATVFQTQSVYIFPILIGFFSFTFPVGLSLYWNTFTIFGIIQQYKISGLGGLKGLIEKINGRRS